MSMQDRRKLECIKYLSGVYKTERCVRKERHSFVKCEFYHPGKDGQESSDRRRGKIDLIPIFCPTNCRDESCKYCHTETELAFHPKNICQKGICPNDWSHNIAKSFGITLKECYLGNNCPYIHCVPEEMINMVFNPIWIIRSLIENLLDTHQERIFSISRTDKFKLEYKLHKLIHNGMKIKIKEFEETFLFGDTDTIFRISKIKDSIICYCQSHFVDEDIVNEIHNIFEFVTKLYS